MQESCFWEADDAERRESMCSALSGGTKELKSATAEPNSVEQMEAIYAAGACW